MRDQRDAILLESYRIAVEYLENYINGTWTRFSILLTVDLAIGGGLVSVTSSGPPGSKSVQCFVAGVGLAISVLLYLQSAQERYIIGHHRERIENLRKKIEQIVNEEGVPLLFVPLDEIDRGQRSFIFESVVSWRSKALSITRLPAIISLTLIGIWGLVLAFLIGA